MLNSREKIDVNGIEYDVYIERKNIKNAYFRFKDGAFYVSCGFLMSTKQILKYCEKFSYRLVKSPKIDLENHRIRIFGEYQEAPNSIFEVLGKKYLVTSEEDFYKKIKPRFLKYITELVEKYEEIMEVPVKYKVRVQKMKTRLGSNSKTTLTLNFDLGLVHYTPAAIESVVVHELAHYFHFDHQEGFYNVVYKYCPNYDKIQKEFRR